MRPVGSREQRWFRRGGLAPGLLVGWGMNRVAYIPLVLAMLAPLLGGCVVREGPPVYYHRVYYYRPVRRPVVVRRVVVGENTTTDVGDTQQD